ncbi:MAG: FkbM family methyltransferase [Turneriella sp.]
MGTQGIKAIALQILPPITLRLYRFAKNAIRLRKNTGKTEVPEKFVSPALRSYAQYQEDLIIDAILGSKRKGFYVDVGANDPTVISNTRRFYDRGWRGINIEPNLGLYNKLKSDRPRDINLNVGIATTAGDLTFYEMSADTLSSFDRDAAISSGRIHGAHLISERKIKVLPLSEVFQKYLPNPRIDFISIDVEGFDLDVLRSNDWAKYRPALLLVEANIGYAKIIEFTQEIDYVLLFFNGTNGFFIDSKVLREEPAL